VPRDVCRARDDGNHRLATGDEGNSYCGRLEVVQTRRRIGGEQDVGQPGQEEENGGLSSTDGGGDVVSQRTVIHRGGHPVRGGRRLCRGDCRFAARGRRWSSLAVVRRCGAVSVCRRSTGRCHRSVYNNNILIIIICTCSIRGGCYT